MGRQMTPDLSLEPEMTPDFSLEAVTDELLALLQDEKFREAKAIAGSSNGVQRSGDDKGKSQRKNITSQSQIVKLQRQAVGNTPNAWIAYEQLLQVCEPNHYWSWMPDKRISDFWRSLPEKEQLEIMDVQGRNFRDLVQEHTCMRTCYCKKFNAASDEVNRLEDNHSITFFQEFFRTAVSEDTCIAVNWQNVETIDGMVQDFIRGGVESREFPHGSPEWCQQMEREHTRLAFMCIVPEIFERRLLSRWERKHGHAPTAAKPDKTKKNTNAESSAARHTRFVVEHLKSRVARAAVEVVDTQKSSRVIKTLCQTMKRAWSPR